MARYKIKLNEGKHEIQPLQYPNEKNYLLLNQLPSSRIRKLQPTAIDPRQTLLPPHPC